MSKISVLSSVVFAAAAMVAVGTVSAHAAYIIDLNPDFTRAVTR